MKPPPARQPRKPRQPEQPSTSRPLVLVHGFMGGAEQWALQAALATKRPLIRLDLPGFGSHTHLDPIDSISGFADWVLAELTYRDIHCFDLLGHSMGGMIVQQMARQAPERVAKLILYSTGSIGALPGRFETIAMSMQRARDDGVKANARRITATWFLQGETAEEYPNCARIAQQGTLPAILAGLQAMQDWSGKSHLSQITSPTLVLWGDGDRTYTWPQIAALWQTIPNSRLAVIPHCAHAIHIEQPELFNQIVDDFLVYD